MASQEPIIVSEDDREWERWDDGNAELGGPVRWKNLITADQTDSHGLTVGINEVPVDEKLRLHRHPQDEVYYILQGRGRITVGSQCSDIESGQAAYIPGDTFHGVENLGSEPLRFLYVFAADAFADVQYDFGENRT